MKYYNEHLPLEQAMMVANNGYPFEYNMRSGYRGQTLPSFNPTYADVFDWMIEKDISIEIKPEQLLGGWLATIERISKLKIYTCGRPFPTWHEAANAAIEGAIEILKEQKK